MRQPPPPSPSPTLDSTLTPTHTRLVSPHTGKTVKEAHEAEKKGTANERQKIIAKKMAKVRERAWHANEKRGTHPGYVVLDENGDMRNARLHYKGNKPRFHITAGRKTLYINTGCSELEIGSRHTFQVHTFMVLRHL